MNNETPYKNDGMLILLDRLFSAFGKEGTKKQTDEWLRVMQHIRADDSAVAIDSLIKTCNRFPTIAEFRTAAIQAQTVRLDAVKEMSEVSPIVRKVEAEALKETFNWWRDRFGSHAPNARRLIGETCAVASKPWKASALFASTISELENEPDLQARYERIVEVSKTIARKTDATFEPMPEDLVGF